MRRRLLLPLLLLTGSLTGCTPLQGLPLYPSARSPLPSGQADQALRRATHVKVRRRDDGTVLVGDRPFFPFGFYHVSWAAKGTTAQRLQDVARLGRGGFNVMVTEPINDRDAAGFRQFLDAAQRSGVYVVPYGLTPAAVKQVGAHPAVLGFKVADDSNALVTPGEVRRRQETFRALAPGKLTYLSLAVGEGRPEQQYFGLTDLVGNQSYPVGLEDIGVTYRMMRSTVQTALARHSVPIANLQAFAWQPGAAPPSPAQLRNMTYQALMAGVRGVVYYAYRSPEVNLNEQPATWETTRQLAREVTALAPTLLGGERTELADGQGTRPLVVQYRDARSAYVFVLNTSQTAARDVRVQLPARVRELQAFAGNGRTLQLYGRELRGRLAPLEVVVYRVR